MHKAWSGIEEVPLLFAEVIHQIEGHMAQKMADLASIWAFPEDEPN